MSRALRSSIVMVVVGGGLVATSAFAILRPQSQTAASRVTAPGFTSVAAVNGTDPLQISIATAQTTLRQDPQDWKTWAELGGGYVEEGRITADPSYYPKAEGALHRSLQIQPSGNAPAMVGMAALSSARHDFSAALQWGTRAQTVAPDNAAVYGVLDDALTQLGRYPEARAAVQHMLQISPSLASLTRASYDLEEHGDVAGATSAMKQALLASFAASDVAFCDYYLGELAFNSGKLGDALHLYQSARQEDPAYFPAIEGVAKVEAAQGRVDAALRDYDDLLARVPLPLYVNELIDYDTTLGRTQDAAAQLSLFSTEARLFAANGVDVDLETAILDADHGDPASAVQHAELEWARRHSVLVADALGWALHAAGRNAEALGYANQALLLGWQNALMYFHRGMIERALGQGSAARHDLATALQINPSFSSLWSLTATQTLAGLEGKP